MTYGNSRGKNPGSRKPRPGVKRNGVGASSSTRGGKFSGKTGSNLTTQSKFGSQI